MRRSGVISAFSGAVMSFACGVVPAQAATLIDYKFTLTQSLVHFSETIGGPSTPVVFDFVVDANAPNLNPPEGLYPFGPGFNGYAAITIGNTTTYLQQGTIQINENQNGDVFTGTANGVSGPQINGRTLLTASFSLFDASGQMLNGIGLPTPLNNPGGGYFALIFAPLASDPEYPTGSVKFDVFANSDGLSISTTVTPLPGTLALFSGGLGALGLLGWRRKRKRTDITI